MCIRDRRNIGPSLQHLMGTDKFGRDILVRIMWGGRVSLSVGFAAALISLGVGVLYGGIAGYFGGKIDMAMMRFVDMMYSIPDMLYVIMIVVVMGPVSYTHLHGSSQLYGFDNDDSLWKQR